MGSRYPSRQTQLFFIAQRKRITKRATSKTINAVSSITFRQHSLQEKYIKTNVKNILYGVRVPKKTLPFPAYPVWTTARFFGFIRSALRRAWTRWAPKYEVLADAKRKYSGDNKRRRFEYQCSECKENFPQKEVEVDHREPCGTLKCYDDIGPFVERLFVSKDKLRVLCRGCHQIKTKEERERKKNENSNV